MRLLLITGGRHHFVETTPVIAGFLRAAGHSTKVTRHARELLAPGLARYDAIVLNTCRGGANDGRYPIPPAELDNDFTREQREAFQGHVAAGGGLVSLHVAPTSCPDWPEMRRICGGGWVWGKSWHPPFGRFRVELTDASHPLAKGLESFETDDEIYCDLDIPDGVAVALHATHDGIDRPMAWTTRYGQGRVANISFGHAVVSCENPAFRRLVLNAVDHVAGG
jgi:uncharacterized protein